MKILAEARAIVENREYNKMVSRVRQTTSQEASLGSEYKQITKLLSSIANVLFSVGAVFVAVFTISNSVNEDISIVS